MKLTALCIIVHPLLILSFSALAVGTAAGREAITNPGFHGLTQVLYEFASLRRQQRLRLRGAGG